MLQRSLEIKKKKKLLKKKQIQEFQKYMDTKKKGKRGAKDEVFELWNEIRDKEKDLKERKLKKKKLQEMELSSDDLIESNDEE